MPYYYIFKRMLGGCVNSDRISAEVCCNSKGNYFNLFPELISWNVDNSWPVLGQPVSVLYLCLCQSPYNLLPDGTLTNVTNILCFVLFFLTIQEQKWHVLLDHTFSIKRHHLVYSDYGLKTQVSFNDIKFLQTCIFDTIDARHDWCRTCDQSSKSTTALKQRTS